MTDDEQKYRIILDWALQKTMIKFPFELFTQTNWTYDEIDANLYACTDDGDYTFHVEASSTAKSGHLNRYAVLKVEDDTGFVTWEAQVPASVNDQFNPS